MIQKAKADAVHFIIELEEIRADRVEQKVGGIALQSEFIGLGTIHDEVTEFLGRRLIAHEHEGVQAIEFLHRLGVDIPASPEEADRVLNDPWPALPLRDGSRARSCPGPD